MNFPLEVGGGKERSFRFVITEVEKLLSEGLCIIPVSRKGDAKVPVVKWQQDIKEQIPLLELYDIMDSKNAQNTAIKCGVVSEGLVCLDLDTKNDPGFEAFLFKDLKEIYPDLLQKMRVEKTPSGGYHLYYKVQGSVDQIGAGCKLASRPSTSEELSKNPKEKTKCFLELRAEGSLSNCFPSFAYDRLREGMWYDGDVQKFGIGTMLPQQHLGILNLCRTLDRVIKEDDLNDRKGMGNGHSAQFNFYEQGLNPFDSFNRSLSGSLVLEEFGGWRMLRKSGKRVMYVKPNKKENEVGATFDLDKRIFRIHTTSTDLDTKSYTPSSLLAHYKYSGNKSELLAYLIACGYGTIKKQIERNIVRARINDGGLLPPNISPKSREEYELGRKKHLTTYNFGTFWDVDDDGVVRISQKDVDAVIIRMGYRSYHDKIYKVEGFLIKDATDQQIFHHLLRYLCCGYNVEDIEKLAKKHKEDEDTKKVQDATQTSVDKIGECVEIGEKITKKDASEEENKQKSEDVDIFLIKDIYNEYSRFIDRYGKLTMRRLLESAKIGEDEFIRSTKKVSYKFFKNCYIKLQSGAELSVFGYEEGDISGKLLFENRIVPRDFKLLAKHEYNRGLYCDFLNFAIGIDDYLKKCIGFYVHDYRDEEGYFIICTESCEDSKDGGGSGKNIFTAMLGQFASFKSTPASQIKFDNNLLQSWNGERIFALSDMPKHYNLVFFKDIITGNAVVNKKYINEYSVALEDMPKLIGSSNFSFDDTDPGIKRRVRAIEFTDFFTIKGGVKKHFGKMFPKDWNEEDFLMFDNFMLSCIQSYLECDGLIDKKNLSEGGWSKQFEQKYFALTYQFIKENIDVWKELGSVSNTMFTDTYIRFCKLNSINAKFVVSSTLMNKALQDYCDHHGIPFVKNKNLRIAGGAIQENHRIFGDWEIVNGMLVRPNEKKSDLPF